MRCDRVIYKTPLSLKAFSTFIAQDADSVGYHVAFHRPCCTLDLSTNLTGERSFSSVKSSFVGATSHIPSYVPHIPSYTLIYPHILSYTLIYPHIPSYTLIYPHIPSYTFIYPHIPSYTLICTSHTLIYPHILSYTLIYPRIPSYGPHIPSKLPNGTICCQKVGTGTKCRA